jgi:hypothetical protein
LPQALLRHESRQAEGNRRRSEFAGRTATPAIVFPLGACPVVSSLWASNQMRRLEGVPCGEIHDSKQAMPSRDMGHARIRGPSTIWQGKRPSPSYRLTVPAQHGRSCAVWVPYPPSLARPQEHHPATGTSSCGPGLRPPAVLCSTMRRVSELWADYLVFPRGQELKSVLRSCHSPAPSIVQLNPSHASQPSSGRAKPAVCSPRATRGISCLRPHVHTHGL